jgi:transcriptional regulator with XRE-family HTH domain
MEKSLYTTEYEVFLRLLRQARLDAGLTQGVLAHRLGRNQSFVSKLERGERRVDVVELRAVCAAIGVQVTAFVVLLDETIKQSDS